MANQYFGAFWDGNLKIRVIEARKPDTPSFFEKFQLELLMIMAAGNSTAEVKALNHRSKACLQSMHCS